MFVETAALIRATKTMELSLEWLGLVWSIVIAVGGVYLGVRTCELFLCFVTFVFLGFIVLTSLFSLFYVTGEFNRFLHRG